MTGNCCPTRSTPVTGPAHTLILEGPSYRQRRRPVAKPDVGERRPAMTDPETRTGTVELADTHRPARIDAMALSRSATSDAIVAP